MSSNSSVETDTNLALFERLQEINSYQLSSVGKGLREKYEGSMAEKPAETLPVFLNDQMFEYIQILGGGHELGHKNTSMYLHEENASAGAQVILDHVTDVKQRANFLKQATSRASYTDGESKKKLLPIAVALLENSAPGFDDEFMSFSGDQDSSMPFGASIIETLQKNGTLEAVNAKAPATMQIFVNQALKSTSADPVERLKTQQIVDALPVPPMSGENEKRYKREKEHNSEKSNGIWYDLNTDIQKSSKPIEKIKALVDSGLALDSYIDPAQYVRRELSEGDRNCEGALEALIDIQKDPKHDLPWRAEDMVLRTLADLSDIKKKAEKDKKPLLVGKTLATIQQSLPKMTNPQIAGFNRPSQISTERLDFAVKTANKPQFDHNLGQFMLRLAVNPTPLSGSPTRPVRPEQQQDYQRKAREQFSSFYPVSDMRTALKESGAKEMRKHPDQCQEIHDMIESGRRIFENSAGLKKPLVLLGNLGTDTPHKNVLKNLVAESRSSKPKS